MGDAWGASEENNTMAQQMLPRVGSQNPDQMVEGENGGWYNVLVYSPLAKEIRGEMDQSLSIQELMPNIMAQPGPGANAFSFRDLKVGVDVIDSPSLHPSRIRERGVFTSDRIEIRSYDVVPD